MARPGLKVVLLAMPGSYQGVIAKQMRADLKFEIVRFRTLIHSRAHLQEMFKTRMDIPARLLNDVVNEKFLKPHGNYVLVGYPNTEEQAKLLDLSMIDMCINLQVPVEKIIDRITNRYIHMPSGRRYHTILRPPRNGLVDDVTGEDLVQRESDKKEVLLKKISEYEAQSDRIVRLFKQHTKYVEVHNDRVQDVSQKVFKHISEFKRSLN